MKIIKGDLIKLATEGEFDVIAHGCNCFNMMGAGIARQMDKAFQTNNSLYYPLEAAWEKGDINKLGQIDFAIINIDTKMIYESEDFIMEPKYKFKESLLKKDLSEYVIVVNAYTQFYPGQDLDYNALALCFKKINHLFEGLNVGLPLIGGGIAGGDHNIIKNIMNDYLNDVKLTLVEYEN